MRERGRELQQLKRVGGKNGGAERAYRLIVSAVEKAEANKSIAERSRVFFGFYFLPLKRI